LIRAWRLCLRAHADTAFTGEGARQHGGRWNPKGLAAVYLAASQSLAALEILVHVDTDLVPNDFLLFAVDISDAVDVSRIDLKQLPQGWREEYPPTTLQTMGGAWLKDLSSAVLQVPSAIIPEESNFVLNPHHPDFHRLQVHKPRLFFFDARLWH
jgi:RES domain-containing protein